MTDESYYNSIRSWRKNYEEKLGAPDGWLSISGLFWLNQGVNRLGNEHSCEVHLPLSGGFRKIGTITLDGSQLTLSAEGDAPLICNGQPVTTLEIKLNEFGASDWIFLNDLKFNVIQRTTRYGVRVYDPNNPQRKKIINVRWFGINEQFCIEARYRPLDEPIQLTIVNVLGDASEEPCNGYVEFAVGNQICKLYPLSLEDGRLWFMFKDTTNNRLSYSGGRFLVADAPKDGIVMMDFNKTYNPPCAYTDFATCPLPPEINRLAVDIVAGELSFQAQ